MLEHGGHIGNVCVLGLGKSGKSVARYCAGLLGSRVDSLFIAAGARNDDSAAFVESLAGPGVSYAFGDDAFSSFGTAEPSGEAHVFDVCIASPGIPFWHELYLRGEQLSEEIMSEVEFAWRESAPESTWVAITGTNGKTTTTSCCAHVLRGCGMEADAVGNIGEVCLEAVAAGQTRVFVAEVSSYQLYSSPTFAPDVAVMLNITPDHLHWHKTLEAYRDAKFKLIDNMAARGSSGAPHGSRRPVVILDATNDVVRAKVRDLRQTPDDERGFDYVPMGTADGIGGDMRTRCGARNAAFIDADSVLRVALDDVEHKLIKVDELQIPGEHNASNALAAASVAVALGADDDAIAAALRTFQPLEHRIEPCGEVAGVACYNDSKATNVDATLKALAAFPGRTVHVLLGGDDKGTDLTELVDAVCAHATSAVCFGDAGPRFAAAFEGHDGVCLLRAEHLEDALDKALDAAKPGDVVLLSPACASFDEFKSFEERGAVFKRLVAERGAQVGHAGDSRAQEA